MKEIRVGLIGTGIIAHQHMEMYRDIPGVKVVAACDLQEEKLNAFCDKYGIEHRYLDYRRLLERDDLCSVDVCLHNNLHAPISVDVMAAGKNCYCEKPMAGSYADAAAMKRAAEHYKVKFHIQLGMLYGGEVIAAKKLIDEGYLGKIYHARSYGYRRRGRPYVDGYGEKEFDSSQWAGHGALYDMGVYHISQLLYLLGCPPVDRASGRVYQEMDMDEARRRISGFDVEELGLGLVKFKDGCSMDVLESWAIQGGEFPPSAVYGAKGGVQFCQPGKLKYYSQIAGYMAETTLDVAGEDYRRTMLDPPSRLLYKNSQAHWVGALCGECEQIDTPSIVLQTMLISEGIFLSDRLGREIQAEEIPELSTSNAIQVQETPFGQLRYRPYPFL